MSFSHTKVRKRRNITFNRFIEEKNWAKASELCREGIEMDNEWVGVVKEWKSLLKKIEKIEGKPKVK